MASAAFDVEVLEAVLDEQVTGHVEGRLVSLSRTSLFFISHDIGPFAKTNNKNYVLRTAWNADAVLRREFCLSVCPSVKRVDCEKTKEKSVCIFKPYERQFSPIFWEEESLVGATRSIWNFGSTGQRWSDIANFEQIIARTASAITLREKSSINTNMKSHTHFPMSPRWSSYVAPKSPKRGLKNAIWPFFL